MLQNENGSGLLLRREDVQRRSIAGLPYNNVNIIIIQMFLVYKKIAEKILISIMPCDILIYLYLVGISFAQRKNITEILFCHFSQMPAFPVSENGFTSRPSSLPFWAIYPGSKKIKKVLAMCKPVCYTIQRSARNTPVGVYSDEGPPVPIPNTAVKLISAENTWGAAPWENRATPT